MTEETNSRLGGLVLLVLGVAGLWWNEHTVSAEGTYLPKLAFFAPLVVALAADAIIHAPPIPMTTLTMRDAFYMVLGIALGVLNLNRYGAFSEESTIRVPLMIGLGAGVVFLAIAQIWKQLRG